MNGMHLLSDDDEGPPLLVLHDGRYIFIKSGFRCVMG